MISIIYMGGLKAKAWRIIHGRLAGTSQLIPTQRHDTTSSRSIDADVGQSKWKSYRKTIGNRKPMETDGKRWKIMEKPWEIMENRQKTMENLISIHSHCFPTHGRGKPAASSAGASSAGASSGSSASSPASAVKSAASCSASAKSAASPSPS